MMNNITYTSTIPPLPQNISLTTDKLTKLKNDTYYYIDNLLKDSSHKLYHQYIFDIKMKLIHSKTINEFTLFLCRELSYIINNHDKSDLINNIYNFIFEGYQLICCHSFRNLKINYSRNIDNCPKTFNFDPILSKKWIDAQTGWYMTCRKCHIKTNQLCIKLGFGKDVDFPNEEDFFQFITLAKKEHWKIKKV